jgi:hypothetical protein
MFDVRLLKLETDDVPLDEPQQPVPFPSAIILSPLAGC